MKRVQVCWNIAVRKIWGVPNTTLLYLLPHLMQTVDIYSEPVCRYVKYYDIMLKCDTNVHVCLLDASKAFDKVNHAMLFIELLKRGLPAIIVRIIDDCYDKQVLCTKWNGTISEAFSATNGELYHLRYFVFI